MTDSKDNTLRDEIGKKYFPCTCGEIYLVRNKTAPDCPFHAYDWEAAMDEFVAAQPKDNTPIEAIEFAEWVPEKPKIKEDCIMLVATYFKDHWETNAFDIIAQDGEDEDGNPAWYWSVLDHGDEWGDFDDIHGERYKIVKFPEPPKLKNHD